MPRSPRPPSSSLSEEQFQAIARALSDPRRFAIFQQIASHGTMACSRLAEQQQISPATISHHLKELAEAGLISVMREGRLAQLTVQRPALQAYIARLNAL